MGFHLTFLFSRGFSTRSVLAQSQASDQWAYYQAKSIKGYIYETQKEKLELELKSSGAKMPKPLLQEYVQRVDSYAKKIKKYDEEKKQIENDARKFEGIKDDAQKHAQIFGMAVIFLQIAILLSSIAALLKKKLVWVLGLAVGVVGLVYFADGFLLFIQ
ncbi:MAG: DUF4337 domain-containing protein [Nitrospirae bacterium]|nr:DUF4337 domain-containing protein [Nitrospirota bacterium]